MKMESFPKNIVNYINSYIALFIVNETDEDSCFCMVNKPLLLLSSLSSLLSLLSLLSSLLLKTRVRNLPVQHFPEAQEVSHFHFFLHTNLQQK